MRSFRRIDDSKRSTDLVRRLAAARNAVAVVTAAAIAPLSSPANAAPCIIDNVSLLGTTISTCAGIFSTTQPDDAAISALLLGVDGVGGNGAMSPALLLNVPGVVQTQGTGSVGILALSVGGVGGLLAGNGGAGSAVDVIALNDITTAGDGAHAISATSQGGRGGLTLPILIGSNGGNGGAVSVDALGEIRTLGDGATGVLARSIGGDGFDALDTSLSGNGGNGGSVEVHASDIIDTQGDGSYGIDALSLGGSGTTLLNALASGNGGNGGPVDITSSAQIATDGNGAHGIRARSVGGNGGTALLNLLPSDGANGGNGGTVSVENTGDIATTGSAAHGILAASEGGIGGDLSVGTGGNGGDGADVEVTSSGNVSASGANSHGISARSAGGAKGALQGIAGVGGDVTVNITDGQVMGGTGTGTGVDIDAGGNARLTNAGRISALSGRAIRAAGTDVSIDNSGIIDGSVTMDATGSAVMRNLVGGLFEGDEFSGGTLVNSGRLSPGGAGNVRTMAIDGDYEQTASGRLLVDADWTGGPTGQGAADKLEITGTANLSGTVVVNPINFPTATSPGQSGLTRQFRIVEADGGVTANGLNVNDTAAVDYALLYPDSTSVDLRATINFLGAGPNPNPNPNPGPNPNPSPSPGPHSNGTGITPNQIAVGTNLNSIFASSTTLAFFGPLLGLETQAELWNALDQLSPTADGAAFATTLSSGSLFAQQLLTCGGGGASGESASYRRDGECVWARGNVRQTDNDGGVNRVGFQESAAFMSMGGLVDLGGPWRVGFGFGYEETDLRTAANATYNSERIHSGAALAYNNGPWSLGASVSGGRAWADSERLVHFSGFGARASSQTESDYLTGRVTAAHVSHIGSVYLKPSIDLEVTHLKRDAYTEHGTGDIALSLFANSKTVFTLSPAIEVGSTFAFAGGTTVRPYVKAGVSLLDTDSFVTTARFAEAPAGIAPFQITTETDSIVADVGGGLDMIDAMGRVLRLQYDGRFGENTSQHSGTAKLSLPF